MFLSKFQGFPAISRGDASRSHSSMTQPVAYPNTVEAVEGVQKSHYVLLSLGEFTEKYGSLYQIEKSELARIEKSGRFYGWLHFALVVTICGSTPDAKCNQAHISMKR